MSREHGAAVPGPEDFDRQLRHLTSGAAESARYREPSAVERATRAGRAMRRGHRPRVSWRNARRARKLREPVRSGDGRHAGSRGYWLRAPLRRGRLSATRRPAPGLRRRRLLSLAKGAGILVGFVALLFVMHMLGLGPH
jgi:hypothetical protein